MTFQLIWSHWASFSECGLVLEQEQSQTLLVPQEQALQGSKEFG